MRGGGGGGGGGVLREQVPVAFHPLCVVIMSVDLPCLAPSLARIAILRPDWPGPTSPNPQNGPSAPLPHTRSPQHLEESILTCRVYYLPFAPVFGDDVPSLDVAKDAQYEAEEVKNNVTTFVG